MTAEMLETKISVLVQRLGISNGISGLARLSGGASQESWVFGAGGQRYVLRRAPGGNSAVRTGTAVPLATEAAVINRARAAGVAVPEVVHVLTDEDGLGPGYIMGFLEGETIARKILRDKAFSDARPKLARQCGEALARIHTIDPAGIGNLPRVTPQDQLKLYFDLYDGFQDPRPVFELAFRWLEDHMPQQSQVTLVHGDFRNGNLMVGPDGLRAVLDWELCHVGDPAEDLGWICVNSWRFGASESPVGGFGQLEELIAGYEAGGGSGVDPERVKFWEVFGTLKWGIMCMMMVSAFQTGVDRSVERAAIGRRSSETEIDLLNLIAKD